MIRSVATFCGITNPKRLDIVEEACKGFLGGGAGACLVGISDGGSLYSYLFPASVGGIAGVVVGRIEERRGLAGERTRTLSKVCLVAAVIGGIAAYAIGSTLILTKTEARLSKKRMDEIGCLGSRLDRQIQKLRLRQEKKIKERDHKLTTKQIQDSEKCLKEIEEICEKAREVTSEHPRPGYVEKIVAWLQGDSSVSHIENHWQEQESCDNGERQRRYNLEERLLPEKEEKLKLITHTLKTMTDTLLVFQKKDDIDVVLDKTKSVVPYSFAAFFLTVGIMLACEN